MTKDYVHKIRPQEDPRPKSFEELDYHLKNLIDAYGAYPGMCFDLRQARQNLQARMKKRTTESSIAV